MLHILQQLYTYIASVCPQSSVSDTCIKCFICFLSYVASIATGCFKSRSGCCTCCNNVSIVCLKCFIYFRCMLQRFHLDVAKVDLAFECCSGTHLPQLLGPRACVWERRGASSRRGKMRVGADRGIRRNRAVWAPT
jgi:hypothetical protein